MSSRKAVLRTSDDNLTCNECGAQCPVKEDSNEEECKVCDDPRQYVPVFTTVRKLKEAGHKNAWWQDTHNPEVWSVET